MTLDEICIEWGIAQTHKDDVSIVARSYAIAGCLDCNGHKETCVGYFPIDPKLITYEKVDRYMKTGNFPNKET